MSLDFPLDPFPPMDLHGLKTYELNCRPSTVFCEDFGQPASGEATLSDWLDSLPTQSAGNALRSACELLCRACNEHSTTVAAVGGKAITSGCGTYIVDWIQRGMLTAIAMDGSAALHDFELAIAGKTGEDACSQLHLGRYGMARETADAFAVAAQAGSDRGLGWALGKHLAGLDCSYSRSSILLAAYRAEIPCTIHLTLGADALPMHPHVSGAALGQACSIDFRRLCSVLATMRDGIWMHCSAGGTLADVLLNAVSVVRNFGHDLEGLTTIGLDQQPILTDKFPAADWPGGTHLELLGMIELLMPLVHGLVASRFAARPLRLLTVSEAA